MENTCKKCKQTFITENKTKCFCNDCIRSRETKTNNMEEGINMNTTETTNTQAETTNTNMKEDVNMNTTETTNTQETVEATAETVEVIDVEENNNDNSSAEVVEEPKNEKKGLKKLFSKKDNKKAPSKTILSIAAGTAITAASVATILFVIKNRETIADTITDTADTAVDALIERI